MQYPRYESYKNSSGFRQLLKYHSASANCPLLFVPGAAEHRRALLVAAGEQQDASVLRPLEIDPGIVVD
jgi:hypothetical protein